MANTLAGTVSRIDADSNEVVGEPIRVGNGPTAVAFGEGSVWVTNVDDADGLADRSGVGTSRGDDRRRLRPVAASPSAPARSGSATAPQNRVVRLDPKTKDVTQTIGVGSGPSAVAYGAGAVWVANTLDGTVSRIDPSTEPGSRNRSRRREPGRHRREQATRSGSRTRRAETHRAGSTPDRADVARRRSHGGTPDRARARGLAVGRRTSGYGAHRGGTLRVGRRTFLENELDPANAYEPGTWNILNITNDGLVGFKNIGGGEGAQVVPNLATSLPTPTDGGKTYAFRLRKEIRLLERRAT